MKQGLKILEFFMIIRHLVNNIKFDFGTAIEFHIIKKR